MQTRNNYQIEWEIRGNYGLKVDSGTGVFNGDAGVILSIDPDAEIVTVCFDEERIVEYPFSELDDLDPAYAVTVHKAQGSEFDEVLLMLPPRASRVVARELLYTGVTRARERLVLVSSENMLRQGAMAGVRRDSGMSARMRELSGG
jgi:exodeoxyribonuclease V alpha subunit